ncbi:hypothetical protein [Botrimarina hoheduenensis]|uniref:Uncharacterized protein n=1 Tax=Botrimarina hoheduenensis TaxID=2528000 RepID=A0A5C5VTT5_9BACT|nr:hypothetical protein [Botrimarina hoheduenensis]TWT41315.1 hypothetical protein Pla111_30290 [Botrimarina hoheduenensis]
MTILQATVLAPRYVLIDDNARPKGPLCRDYAGKACVAVYGFTDRSAYEAFRLGAEALSRPYPLVAGYLGRVFDQAQFSLIVTNPVGPDEPFLNAVDAEGVPSGAAEESPPATQRYCLSRVTGTNEYEVARSSSHDAG